MIKRDKVLSLIGLAMKAGRCASGEMMTESETKSGRARLVIIASDASENTKKKFRNSAAFYQVPIIETGTKAELGRAVGEEVRAVLVVTEAGFAKKLNALAEEEHRERIE